MLRVTVSASGRLNEPFWQDARREYEKRLGAYCKLSFQETPEHKPIKIPKTDKLVALCIEGQTLSSEAFAETLLGWQNGGASHIGFLIGGSDGLPEDVKRQAGERWSFSPMTFPHALAQILLLEQLYRALNLLGGGKYHK